MIELGFIAAVAGATVVARFIYQRKLTAIIDTAFRDRRGAAERDLDFTPIAPDDLRLRYFEAASLAIEQLERSGFVVVGTVQLTIVVPLMVRILVDESHTRFAWIVTRAEANAGYQVMIDSYTDERATTTARVATRRNQIAGGLALSPHSEIILVESSVSMDETLRRHVPTAPTSRLLRASTIDEILALSRAHHEHEIAWRRSQPPDELLDADIRAFLGPHLQKHAAKFKQRLTAPPKATARATR